jgi:hypothetical protein
MGAKENAVSADPGAAYLDGLSVEWRAASTALNAWEASIEKLEAGLAQWQDEATEIGCRNADRYRADLERVRPMRAMAASRAEYFLILIHQQQRENQTDYNERVSLGLARPPHGGQR